MSLPITNHDFNALSDYLSNNAWLTWQTGVGFKPGEALHGQSASGIHDLIVAAPGLTAPLLDSVLVALSDSLTVLSLCRQRFSDMFGETVVRVRVQGAEKLPGSRLRAVSQQFRVELAIVSERPSLNTPGLLVMDMDSTVIQIECIDEIAALAGRKEDVAAVTAKAMRGEIPFSESLIQRVAALKGVEEERLLSIRNSIPLMPGVIPLVQELKKHGWKIAIASGGFTYFADYLAKRLGLDAAISNTLDVEQGKLTGTVSGDIIDASAKAAAVERLAREWNIPVSQTVAMGDGANDLAMMDKAALGVACHAKPAVIEAAATAIHFSGLSAMLYYLN